MYQNDSLISLMMTACNKASSTIMRDFGELEKLQISKKGLQDFVTNADLKSEKIIVKELKRARPGYAFILEEGGVIDHSASIADVENWLSLSLKHRGQYSSYIKKLTDTSDIRTMNMQNSNNFPYHRWIVDPIDGTTNFMHGNPYFCISIALERIENGISEIIAGVIHSPALRETYWAYKGKGAFCINFNDKEVRLRVAHRSLDHGLLCALGSITASNMLQISQKIEKLSNYSRFRCFGAAALELAYVASNKLDLCLYNNLGIWDIAAGAIILKEAGGLIGFPHPFQIKDIPNHDMVIAANPMLYESLRGMLK